MSISESRGRGIQVTIKYGKGYEETWVSFSGLPEEVREDIIEYFGLDRNQVEGLTLSELVVLATNLAHAKGAAASTLGAVSVPASQASRPSQTSGDIWEQAAQTQSAVMKQAELKKRQILAEIEAKETVDELKLLYVENEEVFKDPEVLAAWKARGRELQGKQQHPGIQLSTSDPGIRS